MPNIKELKAELDELGVEYDAKDKKSALEALLALHSDEVEEAPEEEAPEAEEAEEPAPEAKEAPEAEEAEDLGTIGSKNVRIDSIEDHELNGRKYKKISLGDGTTMILSKEDLDEQLN